MNNSEKLLVNIKTKKIHQKSRLYFIFKNTVFWSMGALSVFLGGLSFSIIFYALSTSDFSIFEHLNHSKLEFLFGIVPFIWIFSVLLFFVFSYIALEKTKKGYKIPKIFLLLGNIFLSILIGIIVFFMGVSENIEKIFAENIQMYESIEEKRLNQWSQAENGFLSGIIVSVNEETIIINDFSNNIWEIDINNVEIKNRIELSTGEKIKIIGEISVENVFVANEIRPWEGVRYKFIKGVNNDLQNYHKENK